MHSHDIIQRSVGGPVGVGPAHREERTKQRLTEHRSEPLGAAERLRLLGRCGRQPGEATGRTVLFATHDRSLLDVRPRRVVVLDEGKATDVPNGLDAAAQLVGRRVA